MAGYNDPPKSNLQSNTPLAEVIVPGNQTPIALKGGPSSVDNQGNTLAPAAMYIDPGSFLPSIVQKGNAVTGSAGKTLQFTFATNTNKGNSIVVVMGMGEVESASITLAVTDTQGNLYTEAVKALQSTTLESAIFFATNVVGGADTVTVTIAGASSVNTAIAAEVYEVFGVIAQTPGALDVTGTGNNAGSTSPATGSVTPLVPNEIAFAAIAAGGGTITPGTNWALDSGSLAPTGGNLVSFGAESQIFSTTAAQTATATLSASNAWAIAIATFKGVILPVLTGSGGTVTQGSPPWRVNANSGDFVDGAIATIGTKADAADTTATNTDTLMAFVKGLVKIFASVWDSTLNLFGVKIQAATSGGSTLFHVISAASNNATSLKATAGHLYGGSISNTNAAARFVKFYNKASAPAPATDSALILWTIQVPPNATVPFVALEGGVFSTGIAFAAVANMADTDNTSIGAGDLSIDIRYK